MTIRPSPDGVSVVLAALGHATSLNPAASDVHLRAGAVPWLRQGGLFAEHDICGPVPAGQLRAVSAWVGGYDETSTVQDHNGRRWRATSFEAVDGPRAVFRRIPESPPRLEALGLPARVRRLSTLNSGLIIAAGATGSGKTTTLAAVVQLICDTRAVSVLTIEDPVEYLFQPRRGMIAQREVKVEAQTQALNTSLRSDPNVVLFGECRVREHFELCLTLAVTGHLVLTSVHAADGASTCERIAAETGRRGRSMLAQSLRAVAAQRLVPDAGDPRRRHAIVELMESSNALRQYIKPGGDMSRIRTRLHDQHDSMDSALLAAVNAGRITLEDARAEAVELEEFDRLVGH